MSLPQAFLRYSPLGKQYFSRIEEPVTMMHMVAYRFIFLRFRLRRWLRWY